MLHDFDPLAIFNKLINYLGRVNSVKHNSFDSCLHQILCAHQTRESSCIASTPISLGSAPKNDCILFSVYAKALIEANVGGLIRVASGAPAFIAIFVVEWGSIVACSNDSIVFHYHCSYCPLHAIGSSRGDMGYPHKVRVPRGSQNFRVIQVKGIKRLVERFQIAKVI